MEDKFIIFTLSTTFLILGFIIINASMIQPESELVTYATTSNLIFRYGISGAKHMNELNTFKGIFTKDMVNKDPVKTKLDLTQYELDTIYQKMADIDFFSYPRGFQPKLEGDVIGEVTPFSIYYLEYKDKTHTKVVQWNTKYWAPEDIQYQNLKDLATLIIEIIQAKPEYQKLLEPTAGYA
jgi:hypothetical protein